MQKTVKIIKNGCFLCVQRTAKPVRVISTQGSTSLIDVSLKRTKYAMIHSSMREIFLVTFLVKSICFKLCYNENAEKTLLHIDCPGNERVYDLLHACS